MRPDEEAALLEQFSTFTGEVGALLEITPRGGLSSPAYRGRLARVVIFEKDSTPYPEALVLDVAYEDNIRRRTVRWDSIESLIVLAGAKEAYRK